jgi:hypothetical protein
MFGHHFDYFLNTSLFLYIFIVSLIVKMSRKILDFQMEKQNLSRITIDIPEEEHKKFKALAAIKGKSMRELVVESIKNHLEEDKKQQKEVK